MTLPTYYATGTASVNNGATTITFAGALLGSAELPTFKPGDLFFDPAQPLVPGQRLADVDYGAGTAELWVGWPGASMTADPYEVRFVDDSVRSTAQTRRLLEQLSVVQANGRGLFYRFSATTADADPGEGHLRLNHATIASATAAYVDNADANGAAVQAVLDTWDDGGAVGGRGQLWLRSVAAPATFHAFTVTGSVVDGTGYRKLTLAYVGGSGAFEADDELMVLFSPKGAKGDGLVQTVVPGGGVEVDATDPANPIISATGSIPFATRAAIKALPTSVVGIVELTEVGRSGSFLWMTGDFSAHVAADPQEGIFLPPDSDPTGASGVRMRLYGLRFDAAWFGLSETNSAAVNNTALQAAIDLVEAELGLSHEIGISDPNYLDNYAFSHIEIAGTTNLTIIGHGHPKLMTDDQTGINAVVINTSGVLQRGTIALRNLKIHGTVARAASNLGKGIVADKQINLILDNVSLLRHGKEGVDLTDCYAPVLNRVDSIASNGHQISLRSGSGNGALLAACRGYSVNGAPAANKAGIYIEGPAFGCSIVSPTVEYNHYGILLAGAFHGISIIEPYAELNTVSVAKIDATVGYSLSISGGGLLNSGVNVDYITGLDIRGVAFTGAGTQIALGSNVVRANWDMLIANTFSGGGTVSGLIDQILMGSYSSFDSALNQTPRQQIHTIDGARPAGAFYRWSADNGGPSFSFTKSRGAAAGIHAIVQADDGLGSFIFRGSDGTQFWNAASFGAAVDGAPGSGDMPGRLVFNTAPDGSTSLIERLRINCRGFADFKYSLGTGVPVSKSADFTVADNENDVINNKSSTCVVTLPSASAFPGRVLWCNNEVAFAMNSAASNVVPKVGGSPTSSILPATDGAWARLKSDGTNWKITASGT